MKANFGNHPLNIKNAFPNSICIFLLQILFNGITLNLDLNRIISVSSTKSKKNTPVFSLQYTHLFTCQAFDKNQYQIIKEEKIV